MPKIKFENDPEAVKSPKFKHLEPGDTFRWTKSSSKKVYMVVENGETEEYDDPALADYNGFAVDLTTGSVYGVTDIKKNVIPLNCTMTVKP